MNKTEVKLILQSVGGTHKDIEIKTSEPFFLGRNQHCEIEDVTVSRNHINLYADFDTNSIKFKVLGVNQSYLNGKCLERNKELTAFDGDVVEVLESKYKYKICFSDVNSNGTNSNELNNHKRKLSSSEDIVSNKKRKWKIDIFPDAKGPFPNDGDAKWESFNEGELVVFTSEGCTSKSKIAAYDMDGTLITTKSGRVRSKDTDDWKLAFETVVPTLRNIHEDDYKIVIITNQAGVSLGITDMSELKMKMEHIVTALKVPLQVFVATGKNVFRKPLTGMWQALCDIKNDNIPIDLTNSYYVGDAAGRPENKSIKRKKDHSSVDRLMALNLNLTFYTPEQHFLKSKPEKWIEPEFNPTLISKSDFDRPSDLTHLKLDCTEPEVILMVGEPGSGKSFFCENTLGPRKYEIISRDKLGTWEKCAARMKQSLKSGNKVVIDNTNGDLASRERYITIAQSLSVPCRCFVMATTHSQAQHNIAFRELTDKVHSKISSVVVNSYKKKYKEPTMDEGYTEIMKVEFIPRMVNEMNRFLYTMYLLAS